VRVREESVFDALAVDPLVVDDDLFDLGSESHAVGDFGRPAASHSS